MSNNIVEGVKVNIKATDLDLDSELRSYIENKITKFTKLFKKHKEEVFVYFEVALTTKGQQQGNIYRADCSVDVGGKNYYAESENDDIKKAINDVKDKLFRKIRSEIKSEKSFIRRGQAQLKKMMRFGK